MGQEVLINSPGGKTILECVFGVLFIATILFLIPVLRNIYKDLKDTYVQKVKEVKEEEVKILDKEDEILKKIEDDSRDRRESMIRVHGRINQVEHKIDKISSKLKV